VNPDGIDIDAYGAAGNGSADDTAAFKRAMADAIAKKVPLYLGAKSYLVTDTILDARSVPNITIIGQGMDVSIIRFFTEDVSKPLIRMELCTYPALRDFSIIGSNMKGIGLMLGRYNPAAAGDAKWNAVAYGQFHRIKTAGLHTGIHHDAGWINDFNCCNVRDSGTGMKLHGNAISVRSLVSEANDIGVDIINDAENSTLNFFGGTIEDNRKIGMKVRFARDLNLFGVFFEHNPEAHIAAGTDAGDYVEKCTIIGGSLHDPHPLIFDRVGSLTITGWAEHMTPAPLTVTSNVQMVNIPALQQNFGATDSHTIEAIEITGRNRRTGVPWFATDFSNVVLAAGSTATIPLDFRGEVTMGPIDGSSTLSPHSVDYLSGDKSVRCNLKSGRNYAGLSFVIRPTYLRTDSLCAKIPVYLADTLDAFRIQVTVRYALQYGAVQSRDLFDYVPAFGGDYGVNKMLGRWMSFLVPVNLGAIQSLSGFRNLTDIRIRLYGTNDQPARGDEWFAVDALELYPTRYISEPYGNAANFLFAPLEMNPSTLNADLIVQGGLRTTYASAMPTTGSYRQGDYVRNTQPALLGTPNNRYVVKGWIRLTTGSAHVLNRDWAEDRALTGN
jgi:hypothetical protein